ncbi:hypothetical protein KCMC57_64110 (plasmid) [Kitasatospora sp. CMC57]|uniref:Uncharacterized protein n=1 Tax=Kitasatospora sp. CMC57 TaxID=3231513 RepID=A0AB33KDW6_9ACTN
MTTKVPDALLAELAALERRAKADPDINTSASRGDRLSSVTSLLRKAAADCTPEQRRSLAALLAPDTVGHPDTETYPQYEDSLLARAKTGIYRVNHIGRPLTAASQRAVMDGLADLNRAAGLPPYWWEQRGLRPWSKHTQTALDEDGHLVLRRALCDAVDPEREPYRLRTLMAVELFWDTGVPPEGLVGINLPDLTPRHSSVELLVNPPGRTAAVRQRFALSAHTRAALRLWLPVRRQVVTEHLEAGPDHAANQALFITLHHASAVGYSDGTERQIPPGVRITAAGLGRGCSAWLRWLNETHLGQQGWPVPTTVHRLARGGAANPRRVQLGAKKRGRAGGERGD